jgi:DHA3 family tetracycline resistance protein-like MFS transporter
MGMPGILKPLRSRDFALLSAGSTVSQLGDGIYLVALAWQVYELSNAPTALSLVGLAWTAPLVALVLVGGVVSDRLERRRVMIAADVVRAIAIAALGALSLSGALVLWHVVALVAVYGAGEAFFGPAQAAIVPELVPRHLRLEANSLSQLLSPVALRLAGPALGGAAVAGLGAGGAFLLDAGSFVLSAGALAAMQPRPRPIAGKISARAALREVGEGFRFARSQPWLWGTLLAAAVSLLAFWGPVEVLVPYVVKNLLGGNAGDLGLVFAAGGVGSVLAALVMARRGLPRRHMLFLYLTWSAGTAAIGGYGLATALWHVMIASFLTGGLGTVGMVVWMTLTQQLVPARLLGRVESVDWLVSVGLVPVSFALTGPLAGLVGARGTLVGAGVLGGLATIAFLFFPGMRETETRSTTNEDEISHPYAANKHSSDRLDTRGRPRELRRARDRRRGRRPVGSPIGDKVRRASRARDKGRPPVL